MDVTFEVFLNRRGYTKDDFEELFEEPFSTVYRTRVGFQWCPSALSSTSMEICIRFAAPVAAIICGEFLKKFGEDLYQWVKNCLSNLLRRKSDIGESFLRISSEDLDITVNVVGTEEMISALSSITLIVEYTRNQKTINRKVNISYSEIAPTRNESE